MVLPLTYLPRGQCARIIWIASTPDRRQRLQSSGIIPDGIISPLLYSPRGHICICQTTNATLLLRRKTMNEIFVEIPDSAASQPPRSSPNSLIHKKSGLFPTTQSGLSSFAFVIMVLIPQNRHHPQPLQ